VADFDVVVGVVVVVVVDGAVVVVLVAFAVDDPVRDVLVVVEDEDPVREDVSVLLVPGCCCATSRPMRAVDAVAATTAACVTLRSRTRAR
jgi:hypothetical protein